MKLDVTKAQFNAIVGLRDDIDAMIGCGDDDKLWIKWVKHIDNMMERNNLVRVKSDE